MNTILECLIVERLDLAQLAQACHVTPEWIGERMQAGLLAADPSITESSRFDPSLLRRARRMRAIERDFDANPELAALVADLLDEIDALKRRLSIRSGS